MTDNSKGLLDIGKFILTFAKANRMTFHEDGKRPESDTDHTVMLSVCACALANKLYPDRLDQGLVAQYAIVHDLVEAYALDTDSFGISEEGKKAKDEREHEALLQIRREFEDIYPWIPDTIEKYEALDTKEARFVKTVDKLMTKVTHILNQGAYFKSKGMTEEEMWDTWQNMTRRVEVKHSTEFPELIALIDELILETRKITYGN